MKPNYNELFYRGLRIRLVEEKIIELYPSDVIQSPVHLSLGQEAVAVGVCAALEDHDPLFGTYRGHAYYLAKGGNLNAFFAELYGKQTGCGKGKAGSMHLIAPEVSFMGSSAVVGSTIPHAVGRALAARNKQQPLVCTAVFGDGATEEGVYHECLNFAALHKLPVLFICENNLLAVHSDLDARQSYQFLQHAESYGIPTYRVEQGFSFDRVRSATEQATASIRSGSGPIFIEIVTYRYREHVGPNEDFDAGYRSRHSYETWLANDPLEQDRERRKKLEPRIRTEIEDAVRFAEESPWPQEADLLADVW